ncbi:hypothetical protein BH11MYX2_BH11MYX2_03140 [soil metagenome]
MLAVVAFSLVGCKDDPVHYVQQVTPDAAPDATPSGVCGASTLPFLGVCTNSSQCGSCECHMIIHDSKCDKPCESDTDCPSPSRGCEGQGAGMGFYCRD